VVGLKFVAPVASVANVPPAIVAPDLYVAIVPAIPLVIVIVIVFVIINDTNPRHVFDLFVAMQTPFVLLIIVVVVIYSSPLGVIEILFALVHHFPVP
jgi:hypothetical protein